METEGLKLHTRAVPQSVTRNEDGSLSLNFENRQTHQTDSVVWAIGRTFATDGVNLEAAGVATD